jgi:phospholipid/cholesterol/gamma-HCH transport system ATP-binding protein
MAEEKDADELAAEEGQELPPLPPIALQLRTSDGSRRRAERPAGEWCRANGVTPPPGSFLSDRAGVPGVRSESPATPTVVQPATLTEPAEPAEPAELVGEVS